MVQGCTGRIPERLPSCYRVSGDRGALVAPTGWRDALNPAIYLISLLPGLVVLMQAPPAARGAVALATVAVVLLQHAVNVLNDAADWKLGADVEKHDSWVRVHGDTRTASLHGVASLVAGGALGLAVLAAAGKLWLLGVAAPLVAIGLLYNAGPRPLSYTHLGEWVTGVCYGGVFACLSLLAGAASVPATAAGTLAFAALAVALLLSHQPPQIATDAAAGKLSFAVRYGSRKTLRASRVLFVLALLLLAATLLLGGAGTATLLVFGLGAGWAALRLRTPNPRVILRGATLALLAAALAQAATHLVR